MRVWTSEHTFDHPWETVAQANWRKYPNPMNPSVTGVDVLNREVNENKLISERLIGLRWNIPGWATAIIGQPNICYGFERSVVDPVMKKLTLKSRNLSFTSKLSVDEELLYRPHPDDPSKTLLQQASVVTCRGVALSAYIEGFISNIISKNASKGREAMEWVIDKIEAEVKDLLPQGAAAVDELTEQARKLTDGLARKTTVLAADPPGPLPTGPSGPSREL